jgi:hypothetical protein
MSSISTVKLATPAGIGAAQTATLNVPVGPTYHALHLVASAGGAAVTDWSFFSEIRISLNGRVKYRATGNEIAMLADYYGVSRAPGILPINFSRDYMRVAAQEDYLAWGTADIDAFTIEFDLKSGLTSPAVSVYAVRSHGVKLGQHVVVGNQVFEIAAVGEKEFSDFPKIVGGLMALHIDTANISMVETIRDDIRVQEVSTALAKFIAEGKIRNPRTWQPGYTHIDYHQRDRFEDVVSTLVQDLRVRMTTTTGATGSRRMVFERIEGLPPQSA